MEEVLCRIGVLVFAAIYVGFLRMLTAMLWDGKPAKQSHYLLAVWATLFVWSAGIATLGLVVSYGLGVTDTGGAPVAAMFLLVGLAPGLLAVFLCARDLKKLVHKLWELWHATRGRIHRSGRWGKEN